jgi:hypothetical protein
MASSCTTLWPVGTFELPDISLPDPALVQLRLHALTSTQRAIHLAILPTSAEEARWPGIADKIP